MLDLARLWLRGFVIVTATASNVTLIAGGHYAGAGMGGVIISALWWRNAQSANRSDHLPGAQYAYALGAGCGTVVGMAAMRWLYGG